MTPVRAFIGLGGNLGDVAATFEAALARLEARPGCRVALRSRNYRTPPWGEPGQPDFLNAVAALETLLAPAALLDALLEIERAHGRDRSREVPRWGPRTLDLDLLVHGDVVCDTPALTLPHPRLHERAFVLVPLAEIAPDLDVPGYGRVARLLAGVDARGIAPATD
ncbi:2-amino-4-hydroxy-6-hydroxymethyldihydropteridine diphosphokinase [Coralloluteibacterium stylophorae]|uniref:2-amino-4-hydroxy-6-hydroxymethyldihydropteridine pyrophosphokinase n=2 Tax=Coralloluteibacterium stylophorae TaxID=1776034 RepID=A0AAP2CD34_9GAMM|nr:2-amino-4-hydroxy-6-hydroxymethyldihydropteridine diphosphokinase [Coralloluteibacterium stylophorae]